MNLENSIIFVSGEEAKIVAAAEQVELKAKQRADAMGNGLPMALICYDTEQEKEIIGKRNALARKYQQEQNLRVLPILAVEPTMALAPVQQLQPTGFHPYHKTPTEMDLVQVFLSRVIVKRISETVYLYDRKEHFYKKLTTVELRSVVLEVLREELSIKGSAGQIDSIVKLLLAEPTILVENPEQVSPYLCLENGILNVETKQLLPHSPMFFITSKLRVLWDGSWECPTCDYFFASVAGGDAVLSQRLWETLGFLLSNDGNVKRFVLLQGCGDSGKSVFGELVESFFDETSVSSVDIFKMGDRFTPASLMDKKVNVSMDLVDGGLSAQAVSMIKQITGRDKVTLEEKYRAPFSARLDCKLLFGTNHQLRTSSYDAAFLRRVLYIPFNYAIPKERQIPDLAARLKVERSAILLRAMDAFKQVVNNHYCFSGDQQYAFQGVTQTGDVVIDQDDFLEEFVQSHCAACPGSFVPTEVLFDAYTRFCYSQQIQGISSKQQFSARFNQMITRYLPEVINKKSRVNGRPSNGYQEIMLA